MGQTRSTSTPPGCCAETVGVAHFCGSNSLNKYRGALSDGREERTAKKLPITSPSSSGICFHRLAGEAHFDVGWTDSLESVCSGRDLLSASAHLRSLHLMPPIRSMEVAPAINGSSVPSR